MKPFGLAFLMVGILLIGLSGLERIIIYTSLSDRAGDYQALKIITPKEIWNVTRLTLFFGIALSIIGLIMSIWNYIDKQYQKISEANKQFVLEHGLNMDKKEQ